jgi:hypothetical protein
MFDRGMPFLPSLLKTPCRCSTLGRLLALPTIFEQGGIGLQGTNILAYYKYSKITAVFFYNIGPGCSTFLKFSHMPSVGMAPRHSTK